MSRYDRSQKLQRIVDNMTLPRVQMFFILTLAGGAGFAVSVLLKEPVPSMAVRYPIVIIASYCVFLLILRIWLSIHRNLGIDLESLPLDGGWYARSAQTPPTVFGGGGDFAGAGSGGQWSETSGSTGVGLTSSSGGGSDIDVGGGLDLDDLAAILLAVAAILAALCAIFYVLYIAPILLAEIFIDGAIVTGLYRSMRGVDQRHWLSTAIRKTILPAILVAILFGITGFLFQKVVPAANSLGDIWTSIVG
jgi:hypothetical protein